MGTVRDIRSTPQDVMLDIDAELRHWRGCYRESAFHRNAREFDDYIPTLKFGYDLYLLNYRAELDDLLAALKQRYERSEPEWQRLDWALTEAIIRATWKRMKSGQSWRPIPSWGRDLGATATV
jgi:hypothetical protein